jgi:tetratricopeptide (TPR) repeat protein
MTNSQPRTWRYAVWIIAAIAVIYALLAGLHTLEDFDLFWQLSTGRWILQHHHIPSTDVFSYTAAGQPWIYPVLSGIVFYLAYLLGGYGLLCWLGALCSAGTVTLLVRRGGLATCTLAVIAVPLIANRTQPRAEMFTTLLFAVFLTLLWQRHAGGKPRLWPLPLLMIAWVNLHLGFIAGLALCIAYATVEAIGLAVPQQRAAAVARLRSAWPWLALTLAATLANPWGARLYMALLRQQRAQEFHDAWLFEWQNLRPSAASLHQAFDWRDPQSGFWWLLFVAFTCAATALWRRQWGAAILLAAASYAGLQHLRMQALFACVVVVVGGWVLEQEFRETDWASVKKKGSLPEPDKWPVPAGFALVGALVLLTAVRSFDLLSNRYYLRTSQLATFGTGLSWWFPERALSFMRRNGLPGRVFNGYDLGGYLTWEAPQYLDYIDGRAVPFGKDLFFRAYELGVSPPDSPVWREEAEGRGIQTMIVSLARYQGIRLFPQLQAFCKSRDWRAVYLDEVSAIFVRRTAETAGLVDRLGIDCAAADFGGQSEARSKAPLLANPASNGAPGVSRFNAYANAAGVLYALGREEEALAYLDRAREIFAGSGNLHLTRGLVLEQLGRTADAETEFRASLAIEPTDEAWLDLGLFYMTERRYPEAAEVLRRAAENAARPHDAWMLLGQVELQMGQAQAGLEAFAKAEAASPFREGAEAPLGAGFESMVATGRAKAWYQLGDVARAVEYQEEAVRLAPGDGKLWAGLADLYAAEGRGAEAEKARERGAAR